MVNVTQMLRESGQLSLASRILDPNLYLAEDVADFLNTSLQPNSFLYRWLPFIGKDLQRVYIIIYNVGLHSCMHLGLESSHCNFLVHDKTGSIIMNWDENRKLFAPLNTFSEVSQQNGLTDDDWIYSILFVYLFSNKLPVICEVQKFHRVKEQPLSRLDRILSFIEEPEFVYDSQL